MKDVLKRKGALEIILRTNQWRNN